MKKEIQLDWNKTIRAGMLLAVLAAFMANPEMIVFAKDNGVGAVTQKFGVLLDLVEGIVSAIGTIVTLWGLSEWGIAFQGSEGTMQAQAFKRICGGMVMVMAPQLLALLI